VAQASACGVRLQQVRLRSYQTPQAETRAT
jgi:hypothetical protein